MGSVVAALVACWAGLTGGDALGKALKPLAQPDAPLEAVSARLEPLGAEGVALVIGLTGPARTQSFSLAGPDRAVIDFPELRWRFDPKAVLASAPKSVRTRGVSNLRVGLFRLGRSRLVLDLDRPLSRGAVRIVAAPAGARAPYVLRMALGAVTPEIASATKGADPVATSAAIVTGDVSPLRDQARWRGGPARAAAPIPRPRPEITTIALDPGHGGRDPGATYGRQAEKTLVLNVAKSLRRALEKRPRIRVVMTREDDRFLTLDQRVEIAREARADLFVSIHADALPKHPEVNGAAFYTLSDRASDGLAARLARRENAADDGLETAAAATPWVRGLLVDYAKRSSVASAHHLVEGMVSSFRRNRVPLIRKRPHREAGFRVLRNFDQPSLLIELGFLTSIRDQRRFTNPAWRATAVEAMADAIVRWRDAKRAPAHAGPLMRQATFRPR
ncbi:MAG: N-acetylmuramoyl-L-alanine amidase [Pseudomonadota bacterium]